MRKLAVVGVLVACSSSPKPAPVPAHEEPLPSDPIGGPKELPAPPPATPAHPVATDTYHGIVVEDRYRWLEDNNSAEVKAWADAIDKHTRAKLEAIPDKAQLQAE